MFITDYVKSHNLFADGKHTQGVVLAEIVKPNIPVKNGVIHLIQKPLMVVDSNVRKLLEVSNHKISSKSFWKAKLHGCKTFHRLELSNQYLKV